MDSNIKQFLDGSPFAVVGASTNREKYGNKVLRVYLQNELEVYPVNPTSESIEGIKAYKSLDEIGKPLHGISIITPPNVTESIVHQANELGVKNIWMQPGAESDKAVEDALNFGINVVSNGPCLLVVLGYRED